MIYTLYIHEAFKYHSTVCQGSSDPFYTWNGSLLFDTQYIAKEILNMINTFYRKKHRLKQVNK